LSKSDHDALPVFVAILLVVLTLLPIIDAVIPELSIHVLQWYTSIANYKSKLQKQQQTLLRHETAQPVHQD
jgi:hypothetical protein